MEIDRFKKYFLLARTNVRKSTVVNYFNGGNKWEIEQNKTSFHAPSTITGPKLDTRSIHTYVLWITCPTDFMCAFRCFFSTQDDHARCTCIDLFIWHDQRRPLSSFPYREISFRKPNSYRSEWKNAPSDHVDCRELPLAIRTYQKDWNAIIVSAFKNRYFPCSIQNGEKQASAPISTRRNNKFNRYWINRSGRHDSRVVFYFVLAKIHSQYAQYACRDRAGMMLSRAPHA